VANINLPDVDKLVSIKGLVTRVSQVIPDIKEGFPVSFLSSLIILVSKETLKPNSKLTKFKLPKFKDISSAQFVRIEWW